MQSLPPTYTRYLWGSQKGKMTLIHTIQCPPTEVKIQEVSYYKWLKFIWMEEHIPLSYKYVVNDFTSFFCEDVQSMIPIFFDDIKQSLILHFSCGSRIDRVFSFDLLKPKNKQQRRKIGFP